MIWRQRLAFLCFVVTIAGCGDGFNAGPMKYRSNERLAIELADKPMIRARIVEVLGKVFGSNPQQLRVEKTWNLPDGGRHLTSSFVFEAADKSPGGDVQRAVYQDAASGQKVAIEGGYALYRHHCLHCHGVSGDGEGPTAEFLWPRPRDYRRGMFKITSTTTPKPTRDDLYRTIRDGFANTSMPSFETTLTRAEIEQIIDYVIFLSVRGETELGLANEAAIIEEPNDEKKTKDPQGARKEVDDAITEELARSIAQAAFDNWKSAESEVLNPPARVPPTDESILRGKELFLGRTKENLQCAGCHGNKAKGDGPSFIDYNVFADVIFRDRPPEKFDELSVLDLVSTNSTSAEAGAPVDKLPKTVLSTKGLGPIRNLAVGEILASLEAKGLVESASGGHVRLAKVADKAFLDGERKERDLWIASLDEWDQPLRPANLNVDSYKGGRRPIDIYWRIAKGINGAKMPAHASAFPSSPERMWDIVNFVFALPYHPELLDDVDHMTPIPTTNPAAPPSVAHSTSSR